MSVWYVLSQVLSRMFFEVIIGHVFLCVIELINYNTHQMKLFKTINVVSFIALLTSLNNANLSVKDENNYALEQTAETITKEEVEATEEDPTIDPFTTDCLLYILGL